MAADHSGMNIAAGTITADSTPADIDGRLSEMYFDAWSLRMDINSYRRDLEAGDAAAAEHLAIATARLADVEAELDVIESFYTGWTRFYIVRNNGGHVHSSVHCSTCFPTTVFGWLTSLSGATETEAVEAMGETMCTVCFPSSPTGGMSKLTLRKREAVAAQRAAKKASREYRLYLTAADRVASTEGAISGKQFWIDKYTAQRDAGQMSHEDLRVEYVALVETLTGKAVKLAEKAEAKRELANTELAALGFSSVEELEREVEAAEAEASDARDLAGEAFTRR